MSMKESQTHAIGIAEKVSSVLSVLGAAFIITTFLSDGRFRKPINRLAFYAAWGNLFANVATFISMAGIRLGVTSPLCQFQAFLIQWFMPADAFWTLAMACNVYLTFFKQYDAPQLRKLEWKYLCCCYGIPFIPAFTYFFVRSPEHGRVYGSATLWCWVSTEWNVLRITTFYGPVWIIIFAITIIFVKVGVVVFKWRSHILSMDIKVETPGSPIPMRDQASPIPNKTYEVNITSQILHSPKRTRQSSLSKSTDDAPSSPLHHKAPSIIDTVLEMPPNTNTTVHCPLPKLLDANKATISYCKTALLFFIALLCTWVPSTVNRVDTLVQPKPSPFALEFASALVLPLQGFWNSIIYIATSLKACKSLVDDFTHALSSVPSVTPGSINSPSLKQSGHSLDSTDSRADIILNVDGKKRDIRHDDDPQTGPPGSHIVDQMVHEPRA